MNRLTPRERIYVVVGGGFLALVLGWLLVVRPYFHAVDNAKRRIETGRADLQKMVEMYKTYSQIETRVAEKEQKIRQGGGTILTALEGVAGQAGVSALVESMEERKKPDNDFFHEASVEVSLRKISLKELVDYLYQIESAPRLLLVRKIAVSTRFDQKGLLDARVEVSSFEPL